MAEDRVRRAVGEGNGPFFFPGSNNVIDAGQRDLKRLLFIQEHRSDLYKRIEAGTLGIGRAYTLARRGGGHVELIYFVREKGNPDGLVKVGCSFDPYERLQQLQMFSPVRLALLGFLQGDRKVEKDFHRALKEQHAWGEWFRPSMRLDFYITEAAGSMARFEEATARTERRSA